MSRVPLPTLQDKYLRDNKLSHILNVYNDVNSILNICSISLTLVLIALVSLLLRRVIAC